MTTRDAHRRANIPYYSGTLEQTAAHEALQETAAHGGLYRGDGLCLDPGGRAEHDVPGGRGREHAINYHTVKNGLEPRYLDLTCRSLSLPASSRARATAVPAPPSPGSA